ncbi:uncharacterized protein MELLADRAFT_115459 [Melampsora larici-populina 98AG31]|uniref:E3 ubiquitin protein ligase n=1 Tax=Melampsora larici-populina (strain 98AG31 / pathotype 3-4-7) TaxID=747676 RepID=F4RAS0_MELLP|nr:uncharacterized protein MELLADRAFT_115459 [Melampsora larici-populina 98AG31]EGG10527.1 hypothetical protein MELLADRAFT_115459 [Melampsora larici-populina 98AG31]
MMEDQRKRRIESSVGLTGPTSRKKPMLVANPTTSSTTDPSISSINLDRSIDQSDSTLQLQNGLIGDDERLENFRKEALWRQLQEYKRDLRRAQAKLEQSEDQKNDAEARLAAVDVCWNQLVEDVRILFKDIDPAVDSSSGSILSSLPSSPTSLDRAIQQRSTASKDLIVHLISLASSSSVISPDLEEVRSRCRRLTQESATSRAALSLAESKLKQLQDQLEVTEEAARRAEKKLDRERSRTVRELDAQGQGGSTSHSVVQPEPLSEEVPKTNGDSHSNGARSAASDHPPPPITNGTDSMDIDTIREIEDVRTRELEMLKEELLHRAHEIDMLQWKILNLPDDVVHESPAYKRLKTEMSHATIELERTRTLLETAQKEADEFRERQNDFGAAISTEMTSRIEDLEKKLSSRDADVTRIRATREEARSELHELKSRDAEKMKQVAQIRTLANSRQDRISALASEVRRLKMRLAADVGDKDSVDYLATNEEIELAKSLQARLKKAEEVIENLKSQLEKFTQDLSGIEDPMKLIQSEAEARAEVSLMQKRLDEVESLDSSLEAQKILKVQLAAQESAATMLYTEVDRLSNAWAALDEQNRDKVFKLAEHDEKVLKAVHEKAKADNRYFSAMRANETLKTQSAVLEKMAEKQTTTISKLNDELRAISSRLTSAEKEITIHQKVLSSHKTKISELSIENEDLSNRAALHDTKMNDVMNLLRERTAQVEEEAASRRKAEENLIGLERELSKMKSRNGMSGTVGMGESSNVEIEELKSFNDDLTKMLKCNSCKQRFKSHVITRCMHLFCGKCLDSRIETRQRKCPTCSVGFGVGDVSAVYF